MIGRAAGERKDGRMADHNPYAERPNRQPLPPLIFFGCVALGYGLNLVLPGLPPSQVLKAAGALALGAGLALVMWASLTLARARTAILPHHAARHLVTSGPFALSRNPIYLGEALILSGLAGIESSAGYAAAAALFVILVTRLAIVREEAHLAARFGAAWEAYAGRVRRWL